MKKTTHLYNIISALLAFLLWGGWALYANSDHGRMAAISSSVVQGFFSFGMTFVMVYAVSWVYHRIPEGMLQMCVPSVVVCGCTGSVLYMVHHYFGTPEIIKTILPPLIVGFGFCLFTTYKVRKSKEHNE